MTLLLCVIFFLSGAAALLFETLWFRVAGLALGNSVWASNIVLASFMAGLAAGNAAAARYGRRLRRPLRVYAVIEGVVGLTGVAIVVLLPPLGPSLAPLFARVLAHPWLVNSLRLGVAFGLMVVPTTAMGLTLPLLTKALARGEANFGRVLGRLYGWNTLGGVAGALCGELWLISWLGQRGTALAAAALNVTAAAVALLLARHAGEAQAPEVEPLPAQRISARAWRLLGAAFISGATLLALEVVWFRFLQLFLFGTNLIFAAMLAVILLGIGAGGVVASRWLSRDPRAHRFTALVALAAGTATELAYTLFDPRVGDVSYTVGDTRAALLLSLRLMLPSAFLSGVLFTLLGAAQRGECGGAAEATGKLTLANTLGAMGGALVAGFVMLPWLGMEKALFALTLSYGLVACLGGAGQESTAPDRRRRTVLVAAAALFGLAVTLFPFGLMRGRFIAELGRRYETPNEKLLGVHEGLTETITYMRAQWAGSTLYHRLITNGYSMSATTHLARRYMRMYVNWAVAVNPDARKALLVSYGVGNTAKALTDTKQLESIDVVDISRDILDLGAVVFPGARSPLRDPRVHVHVEDGRFFLQTTSARYDLITGEPPPPRGSGITNLYSREYFQLIHDHLREGGVVTYWLPIEQLHRSESQAILRAFCDAFRDCSLWNGGGVEWMLAGTRGARGPVDERQFSAQWRDSVVGPQLVEVGFEQPEQLGATFIADADTLAGWAQGAPALDDDHPNRILAQPPSPTSGVTPYYHSWGDPRAARQRFASSAFVNRLWPAGLRQRTDAWFGLEGILDDLYSRRLFNPLESLTAVLTRTSLRTLPVLLVPSDPVAQEIATRTYAEGKRGSGVAFEVGVHALSERDYDAAAQYFALVDEASQRTRARLFRALALGLLDRAAEARQALNSIELATLTREDAVSAVWLGRFLESRAHSTGAQAVARQ
jgi:spermidine synthase